MLISLDISTSVVGLAIFDDDYKLHELTYVKFSSKEKDLYKKLTFFTEFMQKYKHIKFTEYAVEEPLKAFKGRFSNANVIQMLTQFNAMISTYFYLEHRLSPVYYNVQTARKTAFPALTIPKGHPNVKDLIWESFSNAHPTINWNYSPKTFKLVDGTYDSVDAAVVGLAHIVTKIRNKKSEKESSSEKKSSVISPNS